MAINNVHPIYPPNDHVTKLGIAIRDAITQLALERPYSYAEIIGVLEMIKSDYYNEYMQT